MIRYLTVRNIDGSVWVILEGRFLTWPVLTFPSSESFKSWLIANLQWLGRDADLLDAQVFSLSEWQGGSTHETPIPDYIKPLLKELGINDD